MKTEVTDRMISFVKSTLGRWNEVWFNKVFVDDEISWMLHFDQRDDYDVAEKYGTHFFTESGKVYFYPYDAWSISAECHMNVVPFNEPYAKTLGEVFDGFYGDEPWWGDEAPENEEEVSAEEWVKRWASSKGLSIQTITVKGRK